MRNSTIVIGAVVAGVAVAAYAGYRAMTAEGLGYVMPTFFAVMLFATAFAVSWGATPGPRGSSDTLGVAAWLKDRDRGSSRK
jgi:hypothetical protein